MRSAPYLPVDIFSNNGYVYTRNNSYTIDYLKEAYDLVAHGQHIDAEENTSITDIVAAYNYYKVAYECKLCLHPIFGVQADREVAFVSDTFDSIIVVVDAITLEEYIITYPWMQKKIKGLINKWVDDIEFHSLLTLYAGLSKSKKDYSNAIIVNRDTKDEYMQIAPFILRDYNSNVRFEPYYYDALVSAFETTKSNDYFDFDLRNQSVVSKDGSEVYLVKDIPRLIIAHDAVYESKSNYIELRVESCDEPRLYVSTDWKHIVDAKTFRTYLVTYPSLQNTLCSWSQKDSISIEEVVYLMRLIGVLYEKEK